MSEQLDSMKANLMACAMKQMGDLEHTNAEELGEVIDMIKDLEEAKYYCAITKSMEERSKTDSVQEKIDNALMMERLSNQTEPAYYGGPHVRYPDRMYDSYGRMYYDGPDRRWGDGKMYYDGRDEPRGGSTERSYTEPNMHNISRDTREGRSYISRKGYVEASENRMPEPVKMQKLEEYIRELSDDITDMIRDASPSERNTLKEKLKKLAEQIS